jgi:fumarylacetoacetase
MHYPQMTMLDETHDPAAESWIESATRESGFPIQNLPFGAFRPRGSGEDFRIGVAIGAGILDLRRCEGLPDKDIFAGPTLNGFMALGSARWKEFRLRLSRALRKGAPEAARWREYIAPRDAVEHALPAAIGDYTDFYTSIHHATSIGRLFRPDNPLLPNYKWVPIGYHGRASTIGVSGRDFHRPRGQTMPPGAEAPQLTPSKRLDYELELGIFIGAGNAQGQPISIGDARDHIFGICLLNDWSARDIQAWEYQPLGPFLSKNFASTISPWIVTLEALAPFRAEWTRAAQDPQPLAYLDSPGVRADGAIDIRLEVLLETQRMRANGGAPRPLSRTSYRHAYWAAEQLVAHHTVNGCKLRPGDLLGTGTLSGPAEEEAGSLVELTKGGKVPIAVGDEQRTFLEDHDRVIFRGWCEKPGCASISLGEVSATVLPPLG